MNNSPMTRPEMPPLVAYYAPSTDEDAAGYPWLIVVDGEPWTRVADADRLAAILMDAGHNPEESTAVTLRDAVDATAAGDDTDEGTIYAAGSTIPAAYAITYAEQSGAYPWAILNTQAEAIFQVADGRQALDALEAVHGQQGDENGLEAVRQALTDAATFGWDRFQEVAK